MNIFYAGRSVRNSSREEAAVAGEQKWGFIINPIAGNGFAGEYAGEVKKQIQTHGLIAELVFTQRRGHARELATKLAADGFSHIVAVGGDGTISEAAGGILGLNSIVFGAIPAGTGNDFIQILGFRERFTDDDWKIFFEQHSIRMDVGMCNSHTFLNGMGLGFDAQVASENYTEDEEVKRGSATKYLWQILKTLLFYKEHFMRIHNSGQLIESKCFMNTVAIGRRFAGGYLITPRAVANDGLLDVCMVDALSLLRRFNIFLKVPKGNHLKDKKVHYYQTDKLSIQFDKVVPYHLDGELYFAQQFDIGIQTRALNIIYNPHGNHFFAL
jgi:YegS/Rv2252/BmrU family lipid kinase